MSLLEKFKGHLLTTSRFGHFDFVGSQLTLATQKSIWERRVDLSGLSIVSATLEWDPYEKIVVNDNFEIIEAEGMVIEVMEALRVSIRNIAQDKLKGKAKWMFFQF